MRSRIILAAAALMLGWALPASAQCVGAVDPLPTGQNAATGVVGITGWALAPEGVATVDYLVDNRIVGRASYGRGRPTITRRCPNFPNSQLPGFAFQLDTTRYLNANHKVSVRVTTLTGRIINLPAKTIQFNNAWFQLKPFGHLLFPNTDREMRGRCNLADPTRRYSVVYGVAFDAGTEEEHHQGVAYLELLLDGAVVANTRTSCFYSNTTGGQTNCYGLRSDAWTTMHPGLVDSDHAAYRFVLDVGALLSNSSAVGGYQEGSHRLTIRAGDWAGNVNNIDDILVTFQCDEDIPNEFSIGAVDRPINGNQYHGTIWVTGWAVDWNGVYSITVRVDGQFANITTQALPRPEIQPLYLGYPNVTNPGFQTVVDTTNWSDGFHTLEVIVTDIFGVETEIGEFRVFFDNVPN